MSEKKTIIVEDVLAMLKDGKTRKEVQVHYELNGVEAKTLFAHEMLKGKRTHKERDFKIMTRAEANSEEASEEELAVVVDDKEEVNIEANSEEASEKKPYTFND